MRSVENIAARTMLCVFQTGAWRAVRLHRAETRAENERHNTQAAKVLVRVTDHQALRDLGALHAEAYRVHRMLTLPSIQDGMRLLPLGREFEHADKMRELGESHNRLRDRFIADYEKERSEAPERLGTLFDRSMWPSKAEVASKFSFKTRYLVCPTDGAWGDWLAESTRAAEEELRDRLVKCLTRVRDRCSSDGNLFNSVFDSLRELMDMVPDLNLNAAPKIEATVKAASTTLAGVHAEDIRNNEERRKAISKEADRVLSVLGGVS